MSKKRRPADPSQPRWHDAVAGAAAVVALAVVLLSGGRRTYEPIPITVLLGIAVAALGCWAVALYGEEKWRRVVGWSAPWLGLAATPVLFRAGVPRVHDLMHFWGLWAYGRCVRQGALLPDWIPNLGAGMPLLQFYGPLNFLLASPWIALGFDPSTVWKLTMGQAHVLTALSTLLAARLLGCGMPGSVIAVIALTVAPWKLAVFHYRGALGEAHAFIFLPLVLAGVWLGLQGRLFRWGRLALGVGLVGLVWTHLLTLLTVLIALAPIALWRLVRGAESRRGPMALGIVGLAACLLSAWWWVPAISELDATASAQHTADNLYYAYADNGITPDAWFRRDGWDRQRVALPESIRAGRQLEGEQMPFYVGAALGLLALAAPWWSPSRFVQDGAAVLATALLLTTPTVAGLGLPLLDWLRFPMRFLSPASVAAALVLGLAMQRRLERRRQPGRGLAVAGALLLVVLVLDARPYLGATDRIPPYSGVTHWQVPSGAETHWERDRVAVPWTPPPGARVRNLELPPSGYDVELDGFFPAYSEWFTPEVYRDYWSQQTVDAMVQAGVGFGWTPRRDRPALWPARPYAFWGGGAEPEVQRGVGRIRLNRTGGGAGQARVLEQWFPGWRVRVDEGTWRPAANVAGFLAVDAPEGARVVEFKRAATDSRRIGQGLTLLTLVGWIGLGLHRRQVLL